MRVNVLGVHVYVIDPPRAIAAIRDAARQPGFVGYVTTIAVHGLMEAQDDPALRRIYNNSFLTLPDGIPIVWVSRARGHGAMSQVYGPDLMRALLAEDGRHFLWGGAEGVAARIDGNVVAAVAPPFRALSDEEEIALVAEIRRTQPHYVWVGIGTPKQERFMARFVAKHAEALRGEHGLVFLGVGAAFDFLSGNKPEGPRWLTGSGLQWLFRMMSEPRRLGPRYLKHNPRFVWGVCKQWLWPRRYDKF